MHYSFKIFYFLWLLNYMYVATESFVELTFDAIPLGHSGLLISWKPNITTQSEGTSNSESDYLYVFYFHTYIVKDEKIENLEPVASYNSCISSEEQYKMHSLNESTLYKITILCEDPLHNNKNRTYSLKMRTELRSKRTPAKPHFEFITSPNLSPFIKVKWYPCGREKICHDQEAGTHFGISIKELDNMSTRKLIEVKQEEFVLDNTNVLFLPGVKYEVVVYSVNGEHKTDSDPQEVFLKLKSSMVQHVKVISLPDSSVLISWNPPKWSVDGNTDSMPYFTTFLNFSDPKEYNPLVLKDSDSSILNEPFESQHITSIFNQRRIFGLSSEIIYTYIIIPYDFQYNGIGFEYRMKHKLQVYDQNLPIAKPGFNYKFFSRENQTCYIGIQWLPCGKSFECKNTKPGTEYSFEVKPKPESEIDYKGAGYYFIKFDIHLVYHVTAKFLIGNNISKTETFIFRNCSEIQENIPPRRGSHNEF